MAGRSTEPTAPPVEYRHAKCPGCGNRFTYWIGAADRAGRLIDCPECGEPARGKLNPAEFLAVIRTAAGSEFDYADWLAGEAVARFDSPREPVYLYVDDERWPWKHVRMIMGDPLNPGGAPFSPSQYLRWVRNGTEITLLPRTDLPR